jgi:DNA invertase Pin-like site-specific DNA recombinase
MLNEPDADNKTEEDKESAAQRMPAWRPQDADREFFRYETKRRIQHYSVPPQTIFRPAKPIPTIRDEGHKRVAVYARVSTKSKEQVSSIENQTKYYTDKIAKTDNWELTEIYSDEGKSGTSKKWRPEFKRMLEDAAKKKMDMIICASVSRFARNISDLIEEVRKLRTINPSNPVGVYFETEDLYTLDPNINERLQMQGLFAEWESGNKSRRMILSYDQRICTGQFPVLDLLGLKHTIEGGFVIVEDQAITVKYIFIATVCGHTAEQVAVVLTAKQRPTLHGRTEWNAAMVNAIMDNERRWGDLEVRKRVVIDYKEKVTAKNDGIREGAYIPGYHEGIVSPEIARAAHMMRASRYKFGSVPDVYVIGEGTLKGFVSISPIWKGIDNRALQDICRQVYEDDEFERLLRDADILNGKEHSNVISLALEDYRVAPGVLFMSRNDPQLTLSNRSLKLNRTCREKLGRQLYVEFLYHPILEVIAVRSTYATNPNAVMWDNSKNPNLQLSSSAFSGAIFDSLDWMKKFKFRFRGITRVRNGERIIFFFLDEPQILVGKHAKLINDTDAPDSTAKYIPYKESDDRKDAIQADGVAYPEFWESHFGVSYAIRQKRNAVLAAVSAADIRNRGAKVTNPFIGVIPPVSELEDELEKLYEAM